MVTSKSRVPFNKPRIRSHHALRGAARLVMSARVVRAFSAFAPAALTLLVSGCWDTLSTLAPGAADGGGDCRDGEMCGGDCPRCGLGEECKRNSDCESNVCNGTCLPAGCRNDVKDEGETDTDCGGSCDPCGDGKRCEQDPHCASGVCTDDRCQEATCSDETKNGAESDQDCGGEDCAKCDIGRDCTEHDDCASGFCHEDTCADPSCGDANLNGSETDIDCGGDVCNGCDTGQLCEADGDCASDHCTPDADDVLRCVDATCDDERKNGSESDTDCGGGCDRCDDGARCESGSDCQNLVCEANDDELQCLPPTCDDERNNGSETGTDCGGSTDCRRCPAGEGCKGHEDCATNSCTEEVCQDPACDDGRLNQDEVAVDCGGDCDGCPVGTPCAEAEDCRSGRCDTTCQKGGTNTSCDSEEECLSGECNPSGCAPGGAGVACYDNVDCLSNVCDDDTCGFSGVDQGCRTDADCVSGRCDESEGECLASLFVIESAQRNATDQQVDFHVWVNRGTDDPSRAWKDVALLYFFTADRGEGNFVGRYYGSGPDQTVRDSRFLAREVTNDEWAIIWRAADTNDSVIPITPMANPIDFQLHAEPSQNFDDTQHFSFQSGDEVPNPRIVLCQRVNGIWVHTQGETPEFAERPCALVVDMCPTESDLGCDVLERRD